jgi:hypothetical protein
VDRPGQVFKVNAHITFKCEEGGAFLHMSLPSGRSLAFPFPRLKTRDDGELSVVYKDSQKGQWVDCRGGDGAFAGTWTENAVSAVARDVLVAAMQRLEAAGYPIVLHVHDELICEVPDGFGSMEEFLRIFTMPLAWAPTLPIAAKGEVSQRYCKIAKPESATSESAEIHAANGADIVDEGSFTMRRGSYDHSTGEEPSYGPDYVYQDEHGAPYLKTTRKIDAAGKKSFLQSRWENGRLELGETQRTRYPISVAGAGSCRAGRSDLHLRRRERQQQRCGARTDRYHESAGRNSRDVDRRFERMVRRPADHLHSGGQ